MEFKAKFVIEKETDEYIYIKDIGVDEKSVTNDATVVVANLYEHHDLKNRRLIYRDSLGSIDEIKHKNGIFTGYAPG